eukprot:CAMPEP_0182495768 /NCGR_PEP_ID=MMETSP1321-20130603/4509_1 /TAXON_ID=91990 /ORGANISM="Bolidomonas sp., Strain RCC1657" /LENGTH=68 /DNA_ID=CAMNT_0024699219 /DNA_START=722 /DNA_END=924 /DNA_ORIENTATION=-
MPESEELEEEEEEEASSSSSESAGPTLPSHSMEWYFSRQEVRSLKVRGVENFLEEEGEEEEGLGRSNA